MRTRLALWVVRIGSYNHVESDEGQLGSPTRESDEETGKMERFSMRERVDRASWKGVTHGRVKK